MSADRRTKAELLAELGNCHAAREQALKDAEWFEHRLDTLDLEAKVIAGCVSNLDEFIADTSGRRARDTHDLTSWIPDAYWDAARGSTVDRRIVRVLGYLARRYGLPDPRDEVEQLTAEVGRLNADLHRARRERDELIDRLRDALGVPTSEF
jgi:hypothetical protein